MNDSPSAGPVRAAQKISSPESLNRGDSFLSRLFVALAAVALICGIFFRLWGLGHKLYSNDEATTSVHVSGHTIAEYHKALAAGEITTASAALSYQLIDSSRPMSSVIAALALEDPQHPPVFYVLARFWERALGSTIAARRALPALFGILVLPAAFLFGFELIGRRFGLLLASLVAVSPFHILYSQQMREYSLWTFFAFASSAALLHALRAPRRNGAVRPDIGAWTIFALLTAGGMYTYTGYLLMLLAQVIYVVVVYRHAIREGVLPFAIAVAVALALFAPWLSPMMAHGGAETKNGYLAAPLPLQAIVLKWFFNVGAVFFDLDYIWHPSAVIVLALLVLAGFGLLSVMRERPRAGGYLLTIGLVTAAAFILRDVLDHQSTSTAARYLIPTWIAFEGVVSYGVWKLYVDERFSRKVVALSLFAVLLLCGVGSAAVSATRQSWWADDSVAPIGAMARTIRAAKSPVTVIFRNDLSDFNFAPMLLSYEIPPNTHFELLTGKELPDFRTTNGDTFLLDPSAELRRAVVARGMQLREVYAEVTPKDDLAALRRRTAQARAGVGYVAPKSSLWLVSKPSRRS